MYKREYLPLLENGFKEIALWQLDNVFLTPFGENEHRKKLIDRLKVFISEFESLGLNAEIWIDGSFSTYKPEPQDIDVVFLLDQRKVNALTERKAIVFENLLIERETSRARYSVDVYYIDKDDEAEKLKWISMYGSDSTNLNSKGIYKIQITSHV